MSDDNFNALAARVAQLDARIGRLTRDKKAGVAYIDGLVNDAKGAKSILEGELLSMLTESGRHKVTTMAGEVALSESVDTDVSDVTVKWAKEELPSAVTTKVTIKSLEEAGAKWLSETKEGDVTERRLVAPGTGETIPGIVRKVTKVAKLTVPKALRVAEESDDGF